MSGVGFDAFGWEIFPYLCAGASLNIIDDDTRISPEALLNLFNSNEITHCFMPTALVPEFINASRQKIKSLQYLLTGGDKLPGVNIEGEPYKLVNNYGPTENTVVTTFYELSEKDKYTIPPIGKPISNTVVRILGKNETLKPAGIAGEICIGGAGLARGYLNLPELTQEKFIQDPFSSEEGARLYRTGDSGRRLHDGNIEYLGRMDEQVKIRGYRIELGEIESVLQECELIRQAVVLAHDTNEVSKRLTGYVVPEGVFDKDAVMSYLSKRLPDYMIPVIWVELESLPLTQNGKIDRKALPDPEVTGLLLNEYTAPRNETERVLAEIWKDLLRAERVGIHDNFFELGGDSIITIQVMSRARRMGYELKPKDIFIHQTIAGLSSVLAEHSSSAVTGEQGILSGRADCCLYSNGISKRQIQIFLILTKVYYYVLKNLCLRKY
ncbi:MAG: non-ribosomal peptide synthetase [Ignavibacteria bacterium]|nr:non-ribosomal peptide synthetase [Ignavibacteria bacterium]